MYPKLHTFIKRMQEVRTWNMKRRDCLIFLGLSGFVLWHVPILDFDLPINHLCLHAVGSLDQLLALS